MKGFILAGSGWVTTIVALVFVFQQQQQLEKSTAAVAATQAALDSANERVTALEARVTELQQAAKAVEPATESKSPKDMVKGLLGAVVDRAAAEIQEEVGAHEAPSEGKGGGNPFASMFEGEAGEKMMEASLDMAVDMQYGGFFGEAGLTPEKEAALREVLLAHSRGQGAAGMAMMRGEELPEGTAVPTEEDLMASVKELLSAEEYEAFEQYQEEIPERMARQQFEMQLNMFAPGMSQESFDTTVDVMAQRLATVTQTQTDMLEQGNTADAMSQGTALMSQAYDEALTELEATLPEEDMTRVRRFVDQQRAMFEMLSNMSNEEEVEKP